jgi:hypothetical protein
MNAPNPAHDVSLKQQISKIADSEKLLSSGKVDSVIQASAPVDEDADNRGLIRGVKYGLFLAVILWALIIALIVWAVH